MKSRDEIKASLKDWMTATTQLHKAKNPQRSISDITYLWRLSAGIKMTDKWVEKALYGNKKECQN